MSEEIRSDPTARGGDAPCYVEGSRSFEVQRVVWDYEDDADLGVAAAAAAAACVPPWSRALARSV